MSPALKKTGIATGGSSLCAALAVMNAEAQTLLPAWFAISCLFLPTFAF